MFIITYDYNNSMTECFVCKKEINLKKECFGKTENGLAHYDCYPFPRKTMGYI